MRPCNAKMDGNFWARRLFLNYDYAVLYCKKLADEILECGSDGGWSCCECLLSLELRIAE